jgi:hypothetical protein
LAFVRQRGDYVHPELNFTDLDRARRQQAFLASAAYELNSAGTLTSPTRLHALAQVAAKDIVIDDGFDLLDLAQRAPALLKGGLSFTTLPVKAFDTIDGKSVNLIDTDEIKQVAHTLLDPHDSTEPDPATAPTPPPARLPAATLDITNATGRDGLAATVGKALTGRGLSTGKLKTERPHTHQQRGLQPRHPSRYPARGRRPGPAAGPGRASSRPHRCPRASAAGAGHRLHHPT